MSISHTITLNTLIVKVRVVENALNSNTRDAETGISLEFKVSLVYTSVSVSVRTARAM